jgi:hypothetical protein
VEIAVAQAVAFRHFREVREQHLLSRGAQELRWGDTVGFVAGDR